MSDNKMPYPPPPAYQPVAVDQAPDSRPTTYNPNYVTPRTFGEVPQSIICQSCASAVVTIIKRKSGMLTWLAVGGVCFFGLSFGCCLIPFCIDDLKDVEHTCPNCHHLVGIHKKL